MGCKPSSCDGCVLEKKGEGWVTVDGLMQKGILIVGEAPGEQEAIEGKPFVGTSGKLLDSILKKAGLSRDMFAVHNVLSCRPPKNLLRGEWYEREAITKCSPNLDATITRLKPKVIIALGNTPLERLTGVSGISRYRGYPLRGPNGTWVVPTYHPSYLLPRRGQKSTSHLVPAVVRDLKLAVEIAENGFSRPGVVYLEDPSVARGEKFFWEWKEAGFPPLSVDIETPYKLQVKDEEGFDMLDTQILRIGYCFKPGYAMSIPYTAEYKSLHAAFLQTGLGEKIFWNGYHFDVPIIEQQKEPLKVAGKITDAMWGWHYLQPDLPRGLESVGSFYFNQLPWKHLSKESPAFYNCADVDCALQNWIGIKKGLEKNGQLEGFERYVGELEPVLKEAGTNGVLIDKRARRKLYKKLRKSENKLVAEIQPQIPDVLRPRKLYKKYPTVWENKRTIEYVFIEGKQKICDSCGAVVATKSGHTGKKGGRNGEPLNVCYKANITERKGKVTAYNVVMDFNPLSSDQLMEFMKLHNHPIGKNAKSGNASVDDFHLQTLIKKYGDKFPIYRQVSELRTIKKSISTYVEGLKPDKTGAVRTQYTYAPASGRLSSKGLSLGGDKGTNLQNIPHRGDHPHAEDIRKMIVPLPGHVFVEADSSAIEAVMTGKFMGDKEYEELATRGIHDAFALKTLKLPITNENIKAFKKASKISGSIEDLLRTRKKRAVHGISYGMSARLMAMLYPEIFPTMTSAQREIDDFYEFVPKLKQFHHEVRLQAHATTYLQLPFGNYRRYFYDVFSYKRDKKGNLILGEDGKPIIKLGEDGKSCIAQKPQGAAGFFMRENAIRIAKEIKDRNLPFILPGNYLVHDSYCLMVPDEPSHIEMAKKLLISHLTRPISEMDNLVIGCEVKMGRNWNDMEII